MSAILASDIRLWAESHIGIIENVEMLKGGLSTSMYHLRAEKGDFALRVIDNDEWLSFEPDLADHEAASLQAIADTDLLVPRLVASDNGNACSRPVVLSTFLGGKTNLQPPNVDNWLDELATTLATIHQANVANFKWNYHRWFDPEKVQTPPTWIRQPSLWDAAIELTREPIPDVDHRFIHRDYHPLNVLFQDGKISGVVDWINACWGPPQVDVCVCCTDLVCLEGIEAAKNFTNRYETLTQTSISKMWKIYAFVDFFNSIDDLRTILNTWHSVGRTDLTENLIQQRANDYLEHILKNS